MATPFAAATVRGSFIFDTRNLLKMMLGMYYTREFFTRIFAIGEAHFSPDKISAP
ncbi:MAG: hypothetical protein R3D69_02760 [Xanthobacteraceae bacterium]